jgi:hypothetical protein
LRIRDAIAPARALCGVVVEVHSVESVMLGTAVPPTELAIFEDLVQQRLHTELPELSPVHVHGTLKQTTLLIVVQHRGPELAHPTRVFRLMERVFHETDFHQRFRSLMYLKLEGRSQPYAFHNYIPRPPAVDVAAQVRAYTPEGIAEQGALVHEPPEPENLAPPEPETASEAAAGHELIDMETDNLILAAAEDGENEFLAVEPDTETAPRDPITDGIEPDAEGLSWRSLDERFWVPALIVGTVISVGVFFGSIYALSRPCVLRSCRTLDVAQELANEAIATLQDPPSGQAVLQAQTQLDRALLLLESIPSWSGSHDDAAELLQVYELTVDNVAELVDALKAANAAANATQNPPLTVEQWQGALDRWNEAIAGLDALPPTSEFYRFAQKKVQEYRQNVSIVNERLTTEKTAVENLALAQEAAKVAEVRLTIAQSLPDLQLAYRTWQTAIDALNTIPPATTSFPEARRLLGLYQPQLKEARDRQTQETFATNAYSKALRLAAQAEAAANQNRWTEAINGWNQAIASLKQIPRDSFNAVQAQPLVNTYSDALSRAESRLEGSLQLQQAKTDLDKVCRLNDRQICVYTVTNAKITVRLTPAYVEQVRQTSEQARSQNNLEAQVDVMDHVFALEQALERISDRAGIPLDIYTTNNILVKSHTPN